MLDRDTERPAPPRSGAGADNASELDEVPGVATRFNQPITGRMMKLIVGTGVRADLGIKLFGVAVLNGVVLVTFIDQLRRQALPCRKPC